MLIGDGVKMSTSSADLRAEEIKPGLLLAEALNTARTLAPLKDLRPAFLEELFKHVAVQTLFTGDALFNEGDFDQQHIYLLHGQLELQFETGDKQLIKGRNNQIPLAHCQPRRCSAVAKTDCNILRIDSDRLDRTLSWSQIADYLMSEISLQRDLDEDVMWMQTVLNSNLFYKVPPVNAEQIFGRLTPMVVDKGEVLIRQGEIGDCCYFIKEGDAEVLAYSELNSKTEKIADISVGRCFGEDALVYETARNATVRMKSDGVLMRLEKTDFLLLLKEAAGDEIDESEAAAMLETPIFIDVRTEEEYSLGHLAFSANIPLHLLSMKKRLMLAEMPYIMYCDTGRRSKAAAYLLGKQGYNVMSLTGGYLGANMFDQLVVEKGYILRDGNLVSGQ